ncbi:hypothetical protein DY000_02037161 [Brassica cretica]|uniref:t-SNARE coiled-coil homology domain-containing protein n=1 Tax=Brassica cretica TaxID=69181 RepID=A0ABQ7BEU7_BRACR|nr:hypothetical protein DY000_02037161 [Brassica cretica]
MLVIMRSGLKVSKLQKPEGIMRKGRLLMSVRLKKLSRISSWPSISENDVLAMFVVKEQMGQDYSYSQPSWSEDYYRNTTDSGYSQAEADILEDQAESRDTQYGHLADKVDHLTFLSGYETQLNQVKDLHNDTEQKLVQLEKLLCELAKKKSKFTNGFELGVGVMVVVLVLEGLVLMYN